MVRNGGFPSLKAKQLLRVLKRELGYSIQSQDGGSHVFLVAPDRPRILWAFHNGGRSLAPREVRKVLIEHAGLTIEQAKEVLGVE